MIMIMIMIMMTSWPVSAVFAATDRLEAACPRRALGPAGPGSHEAYLQAAALVDGRIAKRRLYWYTPYW